MRFHVVPLFFCIFISSILCCWLFVFSFYFFLLVVLLLLFFFVFSLCAMSLHYERSAKNGFIAFNVSIFMQTKCADTEDMSITLKPQSNAFMCNVSLMPFHSFVSVFLFFCFRLFFVCVCCINQPTEKSSFLVFAMI